MKKIFLIFIQILFLNGVYSQTIIKGKVSGADKQSLVGANIYIKGTYEGSISDNEGNFKINTALKGKITLITSYLGYKEWSQELDLSGNEIQIQVVLEEKTNELNAVVCQASTFGAADSKKAVRLGPLDILTTPTAAGDIYGALQTLPGATMVGEDGGLFVRGGEGYETKTFIDGLLVQKPLSSRMPDLPARGRFDPTMFSGTMFSTGGYSAEYGQALSSALILSSNGIAEKSQTGISLLPFGGTLNQTLKNDSTSSTSATCEYMNLAPYYQVVKQDINWDKSPVSGKANLIYRKQFKNKGLLKSFAAFNSAKSSLWMPYYSKNINHNIALENIDFYANTNYNGKLKSWEIKFGASYNYDNENINIDKAGISTNINAVHPKVLLSRKLNDRIKIKNGIESDLKNYRFNYTDKQKFTTKYNEILPAVFTEADIIISNKISLRAGLRGEYSNLQNKFYPAHRLSLAYKTGQFSQVSFANGLFYQSAEEEYLRFNNKLINENAMHYIANYQWIKNDRTFRIETYYKKYSNLVKYDTINSPLPQSYNNNGYGYASGVDLFWRDQKTFYNVDYWISYSFLVTKRYYHDFKELAIPSFFPKHSLSVVAKKYITKLTTEFCLSYSYNSGRHYYNPNSTIFMDDKTPAYSDLSMSTSYITSFFKNYTIIHASISNVLGNNNIYGYNYYNKTDEGSYKLNAIKPPAKRFFVIAILISID